MSDFVISCCSTADLSIKKFKELDINFINFHFSLDGEEFLDDCGQSMSHSERYKRMVAGADAKTSQVSVAEYTEVFEKYLKAGKDIIHVTLSSGISGSYNSAMIAKSDLEDIYPERKIAIIDSLAASSGYGLLMYSMVKMKNEGASYEEIVAWAEEHKNYLHHWFFSTDLTFFIKGGRVSKAAGLVGTLLKICPLLNVNDEGKLIPREKIQSKKKVIKRIVEVMTQRAENGTDYDGPCYISNSDCYDDAVAVKNLIEESFPKLKGKVEIYDIGATIGSHTGPGTVALFYYGDKKDH